MTFPTEDENRAAAGYGPRKAGTGSMFERVRIVATGLAMLAIAAPTLAAPVPSAAPAATPAADDNKLQPEDANFADYRTTERLVFRELFAPGVRARLVAEPSFQLNTPLDLSPIRGATGSSCFGRAISCGNTPCCS